MDAIDIMKRSFDAWKSDASKYIVPSLENLLITYVASLVFSLILTPIAVIVALLAPMLLLLASNSTSAPLILLAVMLLLYILIVVASMLIGMFIAAWAMGGLVYAIKDIYDGGRPAFGDVFKAGKAHLRTNLAIMAVWYGLNFLAMLLTNPRFRAL